MRKLLAVMAVFVLLPAAYAAPVDTAVSTPTWPAGGQPISVQPNFAWIGPSTTTVAAMGANSYFRLEVSNNDPAFGAGNIVIDISTPAFVRSTEVPTANAFYYSAYTLSQGTTYYWRVRAVDGVTLNTSPLSLSASFYLDLTPPTISNFRIVSTTGAVFAETDWVNAEDIAYVAADVADAGAGLAVSSDALWGFNGGSEFRTSGWGVAYSTNTSATWVDGSWSQVTEVPNSPQNVRRAVYFRDNGRLYFNGPNNKLWYYSGGSWVQTAAQNLLGRNSVSYKGKIYTVDGSPMRALDPGLESWADISLPFANVGDKGGSGLFVYNDRLYVAISTRTSGGPQCSEVNYLFSYDGSRWYNEGPPGGYTGCQAYSVGLYNGRLFITRSGGSYRDFDGTALSSDSLIKSGEMEVYSQAHYAGKLWAIMNYGQQVCSYSGGWGNCSSAGVGGHLPSLANFQGRLYAATSSLGGSPARVNFNDSAAWRAQSQGNIYDMADSGIPTLMPYMGKLYVWPQLSGPIKVMTPLPQSLTGADGVKSNQTITLYSLAGLAPSTVEGGCGGATTCAQKNVLKFTASDMAGNLRLAHYTILVDPLRPVHYSTGTYPAGNIQFRRPYFAWIGISTAVAAGLPVNSFYKLQVSQNEAFSSFDINITTPIAYSTMAFTADGGYMPAADLAAGVTYYWRVTACNNRSGRCADWSGTKAFYTDETLPSVSGFTYQSSTGGWLSEGQILSLGAGVTVQMTVQDAGSGLGYSTSTAGYGFLLARAPRLALDGEWVQTNSGQPVGPAGAWSIGRFLVEYENNLYAFSHKAGNTYAYTYDDASGNWNIQNGGNPVGNGGSSSAIVYGGKLYAVFGTDRVASYSQATGWLTTTPFPGVNLQNLVVYSGRLYTSANSGRVAEFDGSSWRYINRDNPIFSDIPSYCGLAVYRGKLFIAAANGTVGTKVASYDGVSVTLENGGAAISSTYQTYTPSMAVYNGKLYVANYGGAGATRFIKSFDGTNWVVPPGFSAAYANSATILLGAYNGFLYFATDSAEGLINNASVMVYDGSGFWWVRDGARFNSPPGSSAWVVSMTQYKGRLYASTSNLEIWEQRPLERKTVFADGEKGSKVLSTVLPQLLQSTSPTTCGGTYPCNSATNKVLLGVSDLAGNVRTYGPYAVVVEKLAGSPVLISTPVWPADGVYVSTGRPIFSWTGVQAQTAAELGVNSRYALEIDEVDTFNSPNLIRVSTPVVNRAVSMTTADSVLMLSTHTLQDNRQYYWRLRVVTALGGTGDYSQTASFRTDFNPPAGSDFRVLDAAGNPVLETQFISLAKGVTVQAQFTDAVSGLAVSDNSVWFPPANTNSGYRTRGYGVIYSTNAGATWIDPMQSQQEYVFAGNIGPMGVFNGELYAAQDRYLLKRLSAGNWTTVLDAGAAIGGLGVWKGKFYATSGNGGGTVQTKIWESSDGAAWGVAFSSGTNRRFDVFGEVNGRFWVSDNTMFLIKSETDSSWGVETSTNFSHVGDPVALRSVVQYRDRVMIGHSGNAGVPVYYSTSSAWNIITGGHANAAAEYGGDLCVAGGGGFRMLWCWSGSGSTQNVLPSSGGLGLSVFNGKLYSGGAPLTTVAAGMLPNGVQRFAYNNLGHSANYGISFGGEFYARSGATLYRITPYGLNASLTGSDGDKTAQTFRAEGLDLAVSTTAATCGGSVCPATNQVVFYSADLAGNIKTFGPYAIRVDSLTAVLPPPVPGEPAAGSMVNYRRHMLAWTGPSTTTVAAMGGSASFNLQLSNDSAFGTPFVETTVAVAFSTNNPTFDGSYTPTADLPENTTVYWRVQFRNSVSGFTGQWSTSSFVTDFTPPSGLAFRVGNSTGGPVTESTWIGLPGGATVQASLQDLETGLAVSPGALWSAQDGKSWNAASPGFGVTYSTNAGSSWVHAGDWGPSNGGATIAAGANRVRAFAAYRNRLYAGVETGGARVAEYDGSWAAPVTVLAGEGSVFSMAVYKGDLYAGTGWGCKVARFNGTSWSQAGGQLKAGGACNVNALQVYNGKLYAGLSSGQVAVWDGAEWRLSYGGGTVQSGEIYSMAVYRGKLYVGGFVSGAMSVFDGQAWTALAGAPAKSLRTLAVYNDRLYAGGYPGNTMHVFDGSSWTDVSGFGLLLGGQVASGLLSHGGKLYAAGGNQLAVYNGAFWSNAGRSIIAGETDTISLGVYNGRLFAGSYPNAKVAELSLLPASLTGADRSAAAETLVSSAIPFAQSQSGTFCNGIYPCSATNQVVFNASDMAGNVRTYGPYAVLVDRYAGALPAPVPGEPGAGAYVNLRRPTLAWTGPSTTTVAAMGGNVRFNLEISENDSNFTSPWASANVAPAVNSAAPTYDGYYAVGADLTENTTIYWRVQFRNNISGLTSQWSTSTFVTDFTTPTASGFEVQGSTGGWLGEGQWLNLTSVNARAAFRDTGAGINGYNLFGGDGHGGYSTAAAYGIIYSSNAGQTWSDFSQSLAYAPPGETSMDCLAVFNGRLYAGSRSGKIYSSADGVNWDTYNTGESVVRSLYRFGDKLYAGTGSGGKVFSTSDGSVWSQVFARSGRNIFSLAAFNGRLYAGDDGGGLYSSADGAVWRSMASPVAGTVRSLAVFNGRLYLGAGDSGSNSVWSSPDGSSWTVSLSNADNRIYALAVFNGRLYAATGYNSAKVYSTSDGGSWSQEMSGDGVYAALFASGGRLYAGSGNNARILGVQPAKYTAMPDITGPGAHSNSMAVFNGVMYAATYPRGEIYALTPRQVSLSAGGAADARTLTAPSLSLSESPSNTLCAGAYPCPARNQVIFTQADAAGNVTQHGPYAVLVDTTPPVVSLTAFSASGTGTLSLAGSGSDALSGIRDYSHWVSPYSDFSAEVSSAPFGAQTSQVFTGMQEATTYYARVYVRDNALNTVYSVNASTLTRGVVHVSSRSLAPADALQGSDVVMLAVDLRTNPGRQASLQRLDVTRTGTASFSDIPSVKVYYDADGNGAVDPGDQLLGTGGWGGGVNSQIALSIPLVVEETSKRVLVVYSFASGAIVDRTAGVTISQASKLVFADPFAGAGDFPLSSALSTIRDGVNKLNITATSVAPGMVQPGTANIQVIKLAMSTDIGTSILDKIAVRVSGTLDPVYVPTARIFRDNDGNGLIGVGDTQLGYSNFLENSSTVTLTLGTVANRTVTTTPSYFLVAVDAAAGGPEGDNFAVTIETAAAFALINPLDTPVLTPSPFTCSSVTVQTSNSVNIYLQDLVPAEMLQGGLYAVALASVSVNLGVADLTRVTVDNNGSATQTDLRSARVYRDQGELGSFSPSFDLLLGSAAFSNKTAVINLNERVTSAATGQLLIVFEVAPTATPNNTAGARFANATAFTTASQFNAVYGPFPYATVTGVIKPTLNPLRITSALDIATELRQGTTNNALLRLDLRSDLNPVGWTALRLRKTGTAPDSMIKAVNVFRDADGSGTLNAAVDQRVSEGSDIFNSGEVNVSFLSPQSVGASGAAYFVTFDMDPAAEQGYTAGVQIDTHSWFTLSQYNFISTNSAAAPYTGGPVNITEYANTVTVSSANIVPPEGAYPGTENVPVFKLTLKTDVSKAKVLSMKFSRGGTLTDGEIKTVKVYYNKNNLPSFDPANIGAYTLVTPSTVTFGSDGQPSVASLNISTAGQELVTAGRSYFVAVDLQPSAVIDRRMTMQALDSSYFTVSAPNSVAPLSFISEVLRVRAPPQVLTAAFENKLSTWVVQGQTSVLVASFTVMASSYSIDLSRIDLARAGSGLDSDITAVKLYRDNGDGRWGGISEENIVASGVFANRTVSFRPAAQNIQAPAGYLYYIVADISETASYTKTFGVDVISAGYLGVNDPHSVSNQNFPFYSVRAVIDPTVDVMTAEGVNSAPTLMQGDAGKVVGRLTLRAGSNSVLVPSIRFEKSGTTPDADITRLRVYVDDGDRALGAGDSLLGTLNSFSSGIGSMVISPSRAVNTAPTDLLVVVDISTLAQIGSAFSFKVTPAVVAPDAVSIAGGTITFSMAGEIADRPDKLSLTFTDLVSQSLYIDSSDNPLAKMTASADMDAAYLTGVKFSFNGTAGAGDISAVKFYRDTDGNGYLDPAYDVLAATAAISAGEALITLPGAGDTVTLTTRTYFVAADIAAGAVINSNFSMSVPNENSIYTSGADYVAPFPGQATRLATIRDPRIPTPPVLRFYKADNRLYPEIGDAFNAYRTLLKFRWTSSANQGSIERVEYYIGSAPADDSTPASSWIPSGTAADVMVRGLNLLNNGAYYISVRTKNSLGAYYSDVVSKRFVVDTVIPSLPAGTLYTTNEGGSVILNWAEANVGVSGVEYYVIEERSGNSLSWVTISSTTDRYLPINEGGFAPSAALERGAGYYYYRVYTVSNAGVAGPASDPLEVSINPELLSAISDASVYPNPFDSRKRAATIAFTLSRNSRVDVQIYDIYGSKIKSMGAEGLAGPNSMTWDGTDSSGRKVSKGVYLCVIKAVGSTKVLKAGVVH